MGITASRKYVRCKLSSEASTKTSNLSSRDTMSTHCDSIEYSDCKSSKEPSSHLWWRTLSLKNRNGSSRQSIPSLRNPFKREVRSSNTMQTTLNAQKEKLPVYHNEQSQVDKWYNTQSQIVSDISDECTNLQTKHV